MSEIDGGNQIHREHKRKEQSGHGRAALDPLHASRIVPSDSPLTVPFG